MNCPRCGRGVVQGSAFCMHCGQALAAVAPPAPDFGQAQADQLGRNRRIVAIASVAGLLAALFGLYASGVLRFGASQPDEKVLGRIGAAPPPVLQKAADAGPPVLNKEAERVVMPDDVYAWLKHLEEVERRKGEITIKQMADMAAFLPLLQTLGAGIGEMNPYDQTGDAGKPPEEVAHSKFRDLKPEWESLITFFQSVPPPAECQPLADDYGRALSEIPGMTSDLIDVMNSVKADPSSALERVMKMKSGSFGAIDRYFEQSDVRLGEICKKYETRKWFNIRTDVGGSILGKVGG